LPAEEWGANRMADLAAGGALATLLLGSAVALPVTALLLWLFRRAVIRGMHRSAGSASSGPVKAPPRGSAPRAEPEATIATADSSLHRTLGAYLLAGGLFVAVQATADIRALDAPLSLGAFAFVGPLLMAPLAFVLFAVLPRNRLRLVCFVVYAVLATLPLAWVAARAGDVPGVLKELGFAVVWALPLIPFASRRLRAAGPLVLVFAVIGVVTAKLIVSTIPEKRTTATPGPICSESIRPSMTPRGVTNFWHERICVPGKPVS